MRFLKFLALNVFLAATFGCALVQAQVNVNVPSARFQPLPSEMPSQTSPFVEPGVYDWDAQMFAPYDFRDIEEPRAPVGFYFGMDRVYFSVSRPGVQPNAQPLANDFLYPVGNDYMWGNRFEGGVMTEADAGWGFEYSYVNGIFFSWGTDVLVANPFLTETGVHDLKLNRVFRQELSSGGWMEPYIGVRYLGVSDNTIEDTIVTINAATASNRFKQNVSNSAFGGHVGARLVKKFGRFGVSTDGSLVAAYNNQEMEATDLTFIGNNISISQINFSNSTFVPALDWRLDLSYAITRDLALRGGAEVLYMWDGIARANTLTTTLNPNSSLGAGGFPGLYSESMMTAGFSFGVEWKR